MEISCKETKTGYILTLHSNVLTLEWIFCLKKFLNNLPLNKSIALDLQYVDFVCVEFLEFLKEKSNQQKIALINLEPELFVLLNLTKYDKFAHIFSSEMDFGEQKRSLINRRFAILECA